MAEQLTVQQKMAVQNRGGKLLVSAAAGSGKTKVLVDRLLLYLTEGKGAVNIDDFLIITYTKAAATELRMKIASKLNEQLTAHPENRFLQHQVQRLYLTKISTVHGFCADILREYAHVLDIPNDFRVAEEQESLLLQLNVLDRMLERVYSESDENFYAFMDSQELGRDDRTVPQILLQVYNSARCHVDPEKWLDKCIFDNSDSNISDVRDTPWGRYLIEDLHDYLDLQIDALTKCQQFAERTDHMEAPSELLRVTISQLDLLRSLNTWDEIVKFDKIQYGTLRFSKKCTDTELVERIKAVRTECKEGLDKKLQPFADLSSRVLEDLKNCSQATRGLIALVKQFTKEYDAIKRSRKILDFSDLEHKTLDLLLGKRRQGVTSVANEIGSRFMEIMVDEYQDTNAVQDRIFEALTGKRQNCFMVGDVKQSIYQFRLADPGIFLHKYRTYVSAEDALPGQGRKMQLSNNFRSAGSVIDAVNDVFSGCMSPSVGGLHYGTEESLHEGIKHIPVNEQEIELHVLDVQNDTYAEEATYTAGRIAELLDGTHMVRQGDSLRPIVPDDIVILLRSPNSVGGEFRYALEQKGIRVNFGNGIDLLSTEEIGFVRAMLQIIDNPMQDIPLASVLSSRIFCFSADDLADIRASGSKRKTLYESVCKSEGTKVEGFLKTLRELRYDAMHCSLSELIDKIYSRLKVEAVFSALEDGVCRLGNLQAFYKLASDCESTSYKELCYFLEYLDSMDDKGISLNAEQGNSGAVTIMSIHKSKGLEFPVVFLCGLSRAFNREDMRAQVLCHKELGIGLNCVDRENRVRYPSVAKKAIATKMTADSISEEMRVLYVAMTRACDRLIMTFALKNPGKLIGSIASRMDVSPPELITSSVNCPGVWILMTALRRMEAGPLFAIGGRPQHVYSGETVWKITVETVLNIADGQGDAIVSSDKSLGDSDIQKIKSSLAFSYPHMSATSFPSKQTATQLKGRQKDGEVAENAEPEKPMHYRWRAPSFAKKDISDGASFGNAVHGIMQYIDFKKCYDIEGIGEEIDRIVNLGLVEGELASAIDPNMILSFFKTQFGARLINADHVLREFKFSILDDASKYDGNIKDDKILLQGVIDCAIIEDDGISLIDFKTDYVTEESISLEQYRRQVLVYADAISRIYQKKIKSAEIYFFRGNKFVDVI